MNFIVAVRHYCVHVIVSNRSMLIGNPYRIYRPQVRRCREWSQVKCQCTADKYSKLVLPITFPSFMVMTHINSRHRRIGHVGALQFEFRVQEKRNGESHVDGGTHIHETSAHIEENLLRNKSKLLWNWFVGILSVLFIHLRIVIAAPNGMSGSKLCSKRAAASRSANRRKRLSGSYWTPDQYLRHSGCRSARASSGNMSPISPHSTSVVRDSMLEYSN